MVADASKCGSVVVWTLFLLATDVIAYGVLTPVLLSYLGGWATRSVKLNIGSMGELFVVTLSTSWILSLMLRGKHEAKFWKYFFSYAYGFHKILQFQFRNYLNSSILTYLIYRLIQQVDVIVADGGMKKNNLHESIFFVALRPFLSDSYIEETLGVCACSVNRGQGLTTTVVLESPGILKSIWLSMMISFGNIQSGFGGASMCEERLIKHKEIHGAEFLLLVAAITAAMTKMIYYNALFAYLRAMNIFIEMNNDGEFESQSQTRRTSVAAVGLIKDDDYDYIYDPDEGDLVEDPVILPKTWLNADESGQIPKRPNKAKEFYTMKKTAENFKPTNKK